MDCETIKTSALRDNDPWFQLFARRSSPLIVRLHWSIVGLDLHHPIPAFPSSTQRTR